MSKKVEIDGQEVEVWTSDEVQAERTALETQYKGQLTEAEKEKIRLEGLLESRAKEFGAARGEFQRLSEEQQSKLTATELSLYKNLEILADRDKTIAENDKKAHDSAVASAIRAKVGADQKLFDEARKMYEIINLEDITPEGIAARAAAAIGALGQTQPDLLAAAGFASGSYEPPKREAGTATFADSQRGKEAAALLGLKVEYTAEEKKALGLL